MLNNLEDKAIAEINKLSFPHITEKIAINNADLLLAGKFVTGKDFQNIEFDINRIDFGELAPYFTDDMDFHMLAPVYMLAYAHKASGDVEYLQLALAMLKAWEDFNNGSNDLHIHTWTAQAAIGRIAAIITTAMMYERVTGSSSGPSGSKETIYHMDTIFTQDPWLESILRMHAGWLADVEIYRTKNFTGIKMDISLISIAIFLGDQEYLSIATERLCDQLAHMFPNCNAHMSNSSRHHTDAVWKLIAPLSALLQLPTPAVSKIQKYMHGAIAFFTNLITPVAEVPAIGDSRTNFFQINKGMMYDIAKHGHASLLYALSLGKHGTAPAQNISIFQKDGYAFFRSSWEMGAFYEATWLMFKSGFSSLASKHSDDLSINLVTKGFNVFVDPGMCSKLYGGLYTKYLQSVFAHNGIIVDNKPYAMGSGQRHKAGILRSERHASTAWHTPIVQGYNNLYHGVYIDRTIIFVNETEFFIVDDIVSDEEHEYAQNFHLSHEVGLMNFSSRFSAVRLAETPWQVYIFQHDSIDMITSKTGDTGNITSMSLRCKNKEELEATQSIQFIKRGSNARFVTQIKIMHDDNVQDVPPQDGDTIVIGEHAIDIASRKRNQPVIIDATFEDGNLSVSSGKAKGEFQYVLHTRNDGQLVESIGYSKQSKRAFECVLHEDVTYLLYARRRVRGSETARWLVGEVKLLSTADNELSNTIATATDDIAEMENTSDLAESSTMDSNAVDSDCDNITTQGAEETSEDIAVKDTPNQSDDTDEHLEGAITTDVHTSAYEFIFTPAKEGQQEPYVKNKHVHNDGDNVFAYELELAEYVGTYDITWTVYRNGEKDFTASGGSMLIRTYDMAGVYSCHYKVSCAFFGEIEAGMFEDIMM